MLFLFLFADVRCFLIMVVHGKFTLHFLNGRSLSHRPCVNGIRSFTGAILLPVDAGDSHHNFCSIDRFHFPIHSLS